jgi:Domain of unknown function (DUF4349)
MTIPGTPGPRRIVPASMMTHRGMRARVAVAAAGTAVLVALVAACGEVSDRENSAQDAAPVAGDAGAGDEASQEAATAGADPGALAVDTAAIAAARDVVRTGDMTLTVDDAATAAGDVRTIASDVGGFVADEQERARDDEVDITIRVPADGFDDVRDEVGDLGDVVEQSVDARDVTAEVVDLDSRIGSLRASVERLRGLLGEAGDVAQLAAVEGELARRETELEAMLGQQRVLADQVALGTLAVHLSEDEQPTVAEGTPGFMDGLRNGWVAAVEAGTIALAAAGFALPFLVPVVLAFLVFKLVQRRRRPPTPASAEPGP